MQEVFSDIVGISVGAKGMRCDLGRSYSQTLLIWHSFTLIPRETDAVRQREPSDQPLDTSGGSCEHYGEVGLT